MTYQRTTEELASDALNYVRQLNSIFARANRDGSYGVHEDYAVHRNGRPTVETEPSNWMSTPSVPIVLEYMFKDIAGRAQNGEDVSHIEGALLSTIENLEILSESAVGRGYVSSMRNLVENAQSVLPKMKEIVASLPGRIPT